jgi:hypothetical protein
MREKRASREWARPGHKRLFDTALPNDWSRLRAVLDKLATHGRLLIVVDQPTTIGALPVTAARASGHNVAYPPGLSMRHIADPYPGQTETYARDAPAIADTPPARHHITHARMVKYRWRSNEPWTVRRPSQDFKTSIDLLTPG